jgi:hypothetical protein
MPYVIPSLRKQEVTRVVIDPTSEKDFPVLGLSVSSKKVEGSLFAEKAREWETQRRELDYKMKIESERAAEKLEAAKREAEEYSLMFPEKKERPSAVQMKEVTQEEVKSEWTTVRKAPRREPRSKIDFNSRPEDELYSGDEADYTSD